MGFFEVLVYASGAAWAGGVRARQLIRRSSSGLLPIFRLFKFQYIGLHKTAYCSLLLYDLCINL